MIPSERKEEWIDTKFNQLQGVIEQLNEEFKTDNSIEDVRAILNSRETRAFFDDRTNRFDIRNDVELDNQEDRDNFEEASSMVNDLFECVKGMVQDTWIMQREEEERLKQARLNRSRMAFGPTPQGGSQPNPMAFGPTPQGGSQPNSTGMGQGAKLYENGNNQGVHAYGDEPRINLQQLNDQQNQSNNQQMMLLAGMMNHMQQEAERTANSTEVIAKMAQKRDARESQQEDQKMNFASKASKLPTFMRLPSAKVFFGGKSITEATTAELRKYYETIASFVETVDQEAVPLNVLIKTISNFTYQPAARDTENTGVESMATVASENFKNDQACHTKDQSDKFVEYNDLPERALKLDEQMYVFVVSQFESTSSELIQYRSRTKEHPNLALYSELMLYIFHTKAGSPIHFTCGRLDKTTYLNLK
jgi:hypothetical protein